MALPDYLTQQDEDTILARMLDALPVEYDKSEGAGMYVTQAPASIELAIADDRLRLVLEWGFASTSFGEFLDSRAEEHGVTRKAATEAKGSVTFTGAEGAVIPLGTEVSTPSTESVPAQVFATDSAVTIVGGTAVAGVTATVAGAAGNVGANTVTLLGPPAITGVTSVTNPAAMTGGTDEETDAALLERYLQRVRNPGSSGNIADYVNWALEVAGVGGASVVALENGAGTVTVAVVNTEKEPASAALVTAVQDYIAPGGANTGTGKAPIGATVTVQSATAVNIDVAGDLVIEAGYVEADVQIAARDAVDAYLKSIAFEADNDVRHARVVTAVLDVPGVTDVIGLTINGSTANIVIAAKEVATLGTTTWT